MYEDELQKTQNELAASTYNLLNQRFSIFILLECIENANIGVVRPEWLSLGSLPPDGRSAEELLKTVYETLCAVYGMLTYHIETIMPSIMERIENICPSAIIPSHLSGMWMRDKTVMGSGNNTSGSGSEENTPIQ